MRVPCDKLILQLDSAFQDQIVTQSGLKLFKNSMHNPEWHTTTVADVVAVPDKLSSKMENRGRIMEARVGDKVIISYQVVFDGQVRENDSFEHNNLFLHEGKWYWKAEYYQILGFVRDEKIHPASGYVFCEVAEEAKEERVGLIYLPESTVKEKPKGKARVVAVGLNRTCEPALDIHPGDTIRYKEQMAEKYEVLGRDYIVLQQPYVLGKEI